MSSEDLAIDYIQGHGLQQGGGAFCSFHDVLGQSLHNDAAAGHCRNISTGLRVLYYSKAYGALYYNCATFCRQPEQKVVNAYILMMMLVQALTGL